MKRLTIVLAILLALAVAGVGIALVLGTVFLPLLVLLGFLSMLVYVGAFLARSKHFWLGGVLGAAIGAALGLWFWRGFDAFLVSSIGLGVLGLMLRAFFVTVKNSGKSWKSSSFIDRGLEEIAYFGNQPTGFFPTPAPPAQSFKRKNLDATPTDDASTGSAGAEKDYPDHLKDDGSA